MAKFVKQTNLKSSIILLNPHLDTKSQYLERCNEYIHVLSVNYWLKLYMSTIYIGLGELKTLVQ